MARWLLVVQPMSANSQQDFSAAGQVFSRLRASFNPNTIRTLTLLHAHDDLLTAILERKKKSEHVN